jgi:SPP1 gp7 family putative phage head morphogenesis protein
MKELKGISVKISDFEELEKAIVAFMRSFYELLITGKMSVNNSNDVLEEAINRGKIYYAKEGFRGAFTAKISRELLRLGAKWDKRQGSWKIPLSILPSHILSAIAQNKSKNTMAIEAMVSNLKKDIDVPIIGRGPVVTTIAKFNDEINRTMQEIPTIKHQYSEQERMAVSEKYLKNLQLDIKKWKDEEVFELREFIKQNYEKGIRYESITQGISDRFKVSISKARFLARQETHLILAEIKTQQYSEAGINKYRWHTRSLPVGTGQGMVRPSHAVLDEQVFSWDNPPTVDFKTGRKAHPGQDYNCRCISIPLWEGEE